VGSTTAPISPGSRKNTPAIAASMSRLAETIRRALCQALLLSRVTTIQFLAVGNRL
jgi:hypothetical protein